MNTDTTSRRKLILTRRRRIWPGKREGTSTRISKEISTRRINEETNITTSNRDKYK